MSLFQKSVLKKYIAQINKTKLEQAYQKLQLHFGDPNVQQNIRLAKEEQYQEGFLRELFVDVLGYTLNPQPNYNLTTEHKNETNNKKADGAILASNNNNNNAQQQTVKAVIELKSVRTTDLQTIELQAFAYKNNQPNCTYVITANFQKLRFYIDNAVDYEEFDLFDLSQDRFALLYLCLHANNLLSDLPLLIKQASIKQEENITKQFYADYSGFKQALYKDLVANNKKVDALTLFKKTQKLLDRFLFVFFAEDKQLLPPNSVTEILNQWDTLKELDAYVPLYDRFKRYFGYLNKGHKGKYHDIFAYNGGLFITDQLLDSLKISDNLLYIRCRVLSGYDFDTDVDTNILGHIFEHSLNELDEITALSEGNAIDKTQTKRKKDGIFYTPTYITKYIVEQTIGQLCLQKQTEMGINTNEITTASDKKTKDQLLQTINNYRNWLLNITILDPACGSGAFLNQALNFLIDQHRLIDTMIATLFGNAMVLTDNVTQILENNLFGVDINEESVEIACLSLWLRTAKVGRKLNDLSRNIKCGNSLINNTTVAGSLAFDWQTAFPKVFKNGGFDVVIGNPPYVRAEILPTTEKEYLLNNYEVGNKTADLYTYFYEKGVQLLCSNGLLGFITANKFIKANYGKNIRQYLSQFQILEIIDFGELPVFADAATCPAILILKKQTPQQNTYFAQIQNLKFSTLEQADKIDFELNQNIFATEHWQLVGNEKKLIFEKMQKIGVALKEYTNENINYGIKTGFNEAFIIDKTTRNRLIAEDANSAEIIKPFLAGDNIRFYQINFEDKYLILTKIGIEMHKYPAVFKHLQQYQTQLENRTDKGNYYWELRSCNYYDDFDKPKIIYPDIAKESRMFLDTKGYFLGNTAYFMPTNDVYLLGILNSKLLFFYYKNNASVLGDANKGGRVRWFSQDVLRLPIAVPSEDTRKDISHHAQQMLTLHTELQKVQNNFLQLLNDNLGITKTSTKLEKWYDLTFKELLAELAKQKISIALNKQTEWRNLFDEQKAIAQQLQSQINTTNKAIDALVYALYQLTPQEIEIVEG